jgi:glycosyltransferase involved in cell wall biosynthesis
MAGSWLRDHTDRPNVIHIHNVHGKYFNLGILPFMAEQARVIFTLHDCWLFTGHCAYVLECDRWMTDCHPCCDIGRYPAMTRDAASYNLKRKKRIFSKAAPVLVTPSQWLCDLVKKSAVFRGFDCRVIYNGIDTKRFCRGDQVSARARLGLPTGKHIILFVANGGLNSTNYKDPELLLAVLERLLAGPLADKVHLVAVGGIRKIADRFAPYVTQIEDTREGLETFYQAADLLAYPTKADNCPLVPMEAMSCGLPVVGTGIGGVPEIVEHGVTGYVVRPGDVRGFAESIEGMLATHSTLQAMALASAARAELRFTMDRMTASYLRLYQELSAAPAEGAAHGKSR